MKTAITIDVDTDRLASVEDWYLAALWHVGQANPAPISDRSAGDLAERIGREIIRRWLQQTGAALWAHQGAHADLPWRGQGALLDAAGAAIAVFQKQGWVEGSPDAEAVALAKLTAAVRAATAPLVGE